MFSRYSLSIFNFFANSVFEIFVLSIISMIFMASVCVFLNSCLWQIRMLASFFHLSGKGDLYFSSFFVISAIVVML